MTTMAKDGFFHVADILPRNEGQASECSYTIYAKIKVPSSHFYNCKTIKFSIYTRYQNIGNDFQNSATSTMYFSRYTDEMNVHNTPDLFIKDNSLDLGVEPNWQPAILDYTKSTSILNNLTSAPVFKTYDGINPNLGSSNFAQRSTLGNLNTLNVFVENRGCAATTSEAYLTTFWTIARVFEPWGQHWHNYNQFGFFASGNKIPYTDPISGQTTDKEMGNHITLTNPWDYKSQETRITIPAGIQPTKHDAISRSYLGGYLTSMSWNPPDKAWYFNASNIFRNLNADPVLCYLAIIEEPYKPNNGFHTWFSNNSNTHITDLALYNNNVATVNSYLATPTGRYKRRLNEFRAGSNLGVVFVDNPNQAEVINLSLIGENNPTNFNQHANIFLTFDEVLWSNWANGNFSGTGFVIVGPNRIRITNVDSASFNGFTLNGNQRGMIGVEFEYLLNQLPDSSFMASFSLGAYATSSRQQIGSPTHFLTQVLHEPLYENNENGLVGVSKEPMRSDLGDLSLFPNPAKEQLTLSFQLNKEQADLNIKILTLQGKLMQQYWYPNRKIGTNQLTFDLQNFPSGIYLIELNTENSVFYQKFIKQE